MLLYIIIYLRVIYYGKFKENHAYLKSKRVNLINYKHAFLKTVILRHPEATRIPKPNVSPNRNSTLSVSLVYSKKWTRLLEKSI